MELTLPSSITITMSESMIVFSLCAIVITVHSLNRSRIVAWMNASVSSSTFAVASSTARILLSLSIALAKQSNCVCPTESTALLSVKSVQSPYLAVRTQFPRCTSFSTRQIQSSLYSLYGIQVFSNRASKHEWLLWNVGNRRAKLVQIETASVHSVNQNAAS